MPQAMYITAPTDYKCLQMVQTQSENICGFSESGKDLQETI